MIYQQTTQFPNILVDSYLPNLTESELKMLLVIIRQTNGWIDKRTGRRKTRDRISHGQFMQKTGLCRKIVSKSIQSLVSKDLVKITDRTGKRLQRPEDRKGISWMYYSSQIEPPRPRIHVSRTFGVRHIGEILQGSGYQ
jgi:hypothetical protein